MILMAELLVDVASGIGDAGQGRRVLHADGLVGYVEAVLLGPAWVVRARWTKPNKNL
jgi:hypothetical protein